MISLKNLSCRFDDRTILEKISLDISSHLSILGSNGAGKSTLAKAICNLIHFEGEILFDGKEIKDFSLKQRAITLSYIPPKLDIYDTFISLEEFVLLGRFSHKKALFNYSQKDREITQKYLKDLNIAHLAKKSINALSSGETQLALIAQALTQESKIIIFDEPTANLDPKNSKIIAQQILKLKNTHQVILITHDITLAAFFNFPVAFIKEKQLHFFKEGFFNQETLAKLYGVEFNSLGVKYD